MDWTNILLCTTIFAGVVLASFLTIIGAIWISIVRENYQFKKHRDEIRRMIRTGQEPQAKVFRHDPPGD